MQQVIPTASPKRIKKALKELRKGGEAELPIIRRQIDAPEVKTLAPDGDFFFPPYVTDPQRAPFCFWRTYYTPQELQNKVIRLTDELADANYTIKKLQQKESLKCQK